MEINGQGEGHLTWHTVMEINGASKQRRYENNLVEKFVCNIQC